MLLCRRSHIVDLLHAAYVEACEQQNPGLVDRTIEAVSGEIGDALSYRYPQPWPYVPELVRYIAAVISAYRVVEAITSLVDTEASSDNGMAAPPKTVEILHGPPGRHRFRQAKAAAGRGQSRQGRGQRGRNRPRSLF